MLSLTMDGKARSLDAHEVPYPEQRALSLLRPEGHGVQLSVGAVRRNGDDARTQDAEQQDCSALEESDLAWTHFLQQRDHREHAGRRGRHEDGEKIAFGWAVAEIFLEDVRWTAVEFESGTARC